MQMSTLVLALALGNLSLCAALFFFARDEAGDNRGAGPAAVLVAPAWARAKQLQALGWGLLSLRGALPELVGVALAGALLSAGVALDAAALWEQAGRRVWRTHLLPALGAALAILGGAWLLGWPPYRLAAAGALVIGLFFAAGAAALLRDWRAAAPSRRALALAMLALSLAVLARGALAPWSGPAPAWLDAAGAAGLYLMMLANAFGCLLLARAALRRELARLDVIDALTDVPNRRGFYQALTPWMALARRPGMPTALIILDLDHFKRVNDNYGHPAGDQVLKAMVDVCKKQLRDSDQMGRLGGAEFAILLPRTAPADAMLVAERIRNAVAATPVKAEKALITMTASLGVSAIRAEDSAVSLFKRADEALQTAKQEGRDRVAEAPPAAAMA